MTTAATAAPTLCIACGTPPRTSFTLKNGCPLLRCPRCALAWWSWPAFDPGQFYDQDYFQSETADKGYRDYARMEAGIRRTARARLRILRRLNRRATGRLLDLGCGTGVFLDEARRAGWTVEGVEVSEYGAQQAQVRGLNVRCGPVEGADLPPATFDAVTLWDVIEHVRDPAGVIRSAASVLKPGGVLAISTGDITSLCAWWSGPSWHLFNLPEHLFFFSPESLRRLLAAAGCQVRRIGDEVNWSPLAYIVERLEKSRARPVPAGRWLAERNWLIPATLFDVMGIYAIRETVHEGA